MPAGDLNENAIPVVDLFAGPGGLGEGFASLRKRSGGACFRTVLSIEMHPIAHKTLRLRSFFRQFAGRRVPSAYYDFMRHTERPLDVRLEELWDEHPTEAARAANEAWLAELGKEDCARVHARITAALNGTRNWILLGGPPCQAYSLVGRARRKRIKKYRPEEDEKQYLYKEYLHVIAEHEPAVFVMENVKGLLSVTLKNQSIFEQIVEDLKSPAAALRADRAIKPRKGTSGNAKYQVVSLVTDPDTNGSNLRDFIVPMERHGIPQARHRLILLGVREDLGNAEIGRLPICKPVPAKDVLHGLPRLRSGLSQEQDSGDEWLGLLDDAIDRRWFRASRNKAGQAVYDRLVATLDQLRLPRCGRGSEFIECDPKPDYRPRWFHDPRIGGTCHHAARSHIAKDLYRYLYAACFARARRRSPVLREFPRDLLPDHRNVAAAMNGGLFSDRFRVQLATLPATTVTCHIAKDGHYYIHYDPTQCRSLTVREAARLQTFPDNYFFCGPRTSQYVQVGNAVPPLLAREIGRIVFKLLEAVGVAP